MILSLDISTKKTGIVVIHNEKVIVYHCLKQIVNKNLHFNVKLIKNTLLFKRWIMKNLQHLVITKIIVETTPIPGITGRKLLLYLGHFLGAIIDVFKDLEEIKYVSAQDGQALAFKGIDKNNFSHYYKKRIKDLSIIRAKKMIKGNINDDIADAINMGLFYDKLPFLDVKAQWIEQKRKNAKRKT